MSLIRVLLIGGPSHTGKSTLAETLAAELGWNHVSTDSMARHPGRPEVSTVIVGTLNPGHLASNVEIIGDGMTVSGAAIADLERRYDDVGGDWEQRG